MRIFILNFFIGIFSSDDTEFILRFPAVAITHGFSQMRPVRSLQIPPEVGKSPTDFTDIHRFLGDVFCHADFADDADFSSGIFSLDDTEFILRFPAETITHGFSQMRPVRSLQIPQRLENVPQISQIYTDFSWDVFFSHADFADDADFSSGFYHRTTRNLFGDFLLRRLLTDFRGCDLSCRCRYPLRLDKEIHQRFHRKSVYICEICGTKIIPRRKDTP